MSRSWAEVKRLLDDPHVDAETKEHLLAAYIREEGYIVEDGLGGPVYLDEDELPSEVRSYTDKYQLGIDDMWQGDLDEVYETAETESEDKGYQDEQTDRRVAEGRTTLDGMQPPVEGSSSGVEKSDEIFEAARPALRLWEDFLPVNDKVPSDSLGYYGKINLDNDIKKRFDEQVGISFKNFLDDAQRLRAAYTELTGLNSSTETELNSLYREWTGPAANASYQNYSEKIVPNVTDLLEYLATAPDMISTAVTDIFTACKDKANDVIAMYDNCRGTVGSATPDMAAKVVKLASGDFNSQDEVLEVAAWVDSVCGSNLEQTMRHDDCGMNDENKRYVISECKKWIRDSFNADLHDSMYVTFKNACDDALEAVNSHYETLNDYLSEYENKFSAAQSPTQNPSQNPNQQPGDSNTPPPSSNTPPPSSSTPPGSSTPGSSTPGSSTPPQATMPPPPTPPAMPGVPTPGSSTDPSGATSPSGSTPLPGIGTPGSSMPGAPGAIDPATGLPIPGAGVAPGGGVPKQVTIKDGNRTITVGQPDMRGRSKVTVDDGTGQPREYDVDFTPDEPGETYEDGVIKAGPDGKVVIPDGDATLTLEQTPGKSDQMKMTVDDGTPATYDFDFDAGSDVPSPGLKDGPPPGGVDVPGGSGSGGGGAGGGLGGGGGGGGGIGSPETPGMSSAGTTPGPGTMVGAQAPDTGNQGAGAAAAAAAGAGAGGGGAAGAPPMGGMPMGGMGGGAGQGGGGDQTRQSKWRTTGSLFDDKDPAANFSGVVGRDPAEKAKTPPKR